MPLRRDVLPEPLAEQVTYLAVEGVFITCPLQCVSALNPRQPMTWLHSPACTLRSLTI
jgi:hypothetical protein